MIPKDCKRLIEVDFPIAEVSKHSAREKSIRHGHPSTLHLWWARRPLAACRAVLMGLLLPAPTDDNCPQAFKAGARRILLAMNGRPRGWVDQVKSDLGLQKTLLQFIANFANWDNSTDRAYLETARALVKAAHGDEPPLVVDPFAGGGSIPLEALRLGCEAFASDLNPVACLILKTLLEDIPRHGAGLADELRRVGAKVKAEAEKELERFYPVDEDGARPIAYLWARTVRCESPNCGAEIPLVRSFWLVKKANRKRALRYAIERLRTKPPFLKFEIYTPKSESAVPKATVSRANATCPCCNVVLPAPRVRAQLATQRGGADVVFDAKGQRIGGARLQVVVTSDNDSSVRQYRLPTECDYAAVRAAQRAMTSLACGTVPNEPSPAGGGAGAGRAFSVQRFGMETFGDLFSARQKLTLVKLADEVRSIKCSDTLKVCLAMTQSKQADYLSSLCTWHYHNREKVNHTFARQALPFITDFVETVFCANGSGAWDGLSDWTARAVERASFLPTNASVQVSDACASPLPDAASGVWFTDPPYYDAVPYSDLSDFFFVWLKRALPDHPLVRDPFDSRNTLTPKAQEIVQDESRAVDGGVKDRDFFEREMTRAFAEGRRVLRDDGIGCVVFAHKTTEGWEALLTGMLRAGWTITASWPITTEMASRLRARDSAALAASVHLVVRPRPADAGVGDWGEISRALPRRIREWMERLSDEGIRGADLVFSCIGPALELFSRYERVETADGKVIPLGGNPEAIEPHKRGFLSFVWQTVGRVALQQVLGSGESRVTSDETGVGALEEDARLTALFLWTLQSTNSNGDTATGGRGDGETDDDEEGEDDEDSASAKRKQAGFTLVYDIARRFAQPLGIHLDDWRGRIIEMDKGIVRLLPVTERAEQLFGPEGAERIAEALTQSRVTVDQLSLALYPDEGAAPPVRGRRNPSRERTDPRGRTKPIAARREPTTLDRLHAAMLLQSGGQSAALRAMLQQEVDRSPDFLRLANALSALYPRDSEEKRLLDGMLLAVPRR